MMHGLVCNRHFTHTLYRILFVQRLPTIAPELTHLLLLLVICVPRCNNTCIRYIQERCYVNTQITLTGYSVIYDTMYTW